VDSYWPCLVLNADLETSSGLILSKWYIDLKSNLKKRFLLLVVDQLNHLYKIKPFFSVIVFNSQWSGRNLTVPSFFFPNKTREPHINTRGLINLFCNSSSNWIFNFLNFVGAYDMRLWKWVKLWELIDLIIDFSLWGSHLVILQEKHLLAYRLQGYLLFFIFFLNADGMTSMLNTSLTQ